MPGFHWWAEFVWVGADHHIYGVWKQREHKWAAVSTRARVSHLVLPKVNYPLKKEPKAFAEVPASAELLDCAWMWCSHSSTLVLRHLLQFISVATKLGQFPANKKKEKKNISCKLLGWLSKKNKIHITYLCSFTGNFLLIFQVIAIDKERLRWER